MSGIQWDCAIGTRFSQQIQESLDSSLSLTCPPHMLVHTCPSNPSASSINQWRLQNTSIIQHSFPYRLSLSLSKLLSGTIVKDFEMSKKDYQMFSLAHFFLVICAFYSFFWIYFTTLLNCKKLIVMHMILIHNKCNWLLPCEYWPVLHLLALKLISALQIGKTCVFFVFFFGLVVTSYWFLH